MLSHCSVLIYHTGSPTWQSVLRHEEAVPDLLNLPHGQSAPGLGQKHFGQAGARVRGKGEEDGLVLGGVGAGHLKGAQQPLLLPVPQVHAVVGDAGQAHQKLFVAE